MDTNEIEERLHRFPKENVTEIKFPRARRIFVRIKKESFKEVVEYLVNNLGFRHLSTITGVDLGKEIELLYHLAHNGAIELSLGLSIPKDNACITTITDLIPGAVLYEREVHDLFGVKFEGHPDLSPLLLPEGWPQEVYPLRKEHSLNELREFMSKKWG
jgi:membrane-bound hydrogenase subunit beta